MFKKQIKYLLAKTFGIEVSKIQSNAELIVYKKTYDSNFEIFDNYWIGGKYNAPNFSTGHHGILKQWWENLSNMNNCLLISENNNVKQKFKSDYPNSKFTTLDYYDNLGPVDIVADLCGEMPATESCKYDLIVCQATLEHLYNPFGAMKNMINMLDENGILVIHTHTPGFYYHPYPRDYIRFHHDWFEDICKFIPCNELLELITIRGHVFAAYKKVKTLEST